MLDTLDDFRPAEVAQVLWGMARLGVHPGATFLAEVVDAVQWRLQHYATQVGWGPARGAAQTGDDAAGRVGVCV